MADDSRRINKITIMTGGVKNDFMGYIFFKNLDLDEHSTVSWSKFEAKIRAFDRVLCNFIFLCDTVLLDRERAYITRREWVIVYIIVLSYRILPLWTFLGYWWKCRV